MFKKLLFTVVLAAFHVTAIADMQTKTAAYEVAASDFRAPGTAGGTLGMRECSDCTPKTLRVTAKTRYLVNNQAVSLSDFRQQLQDNRNRERTLVIVSLDLKSDTVTEVTVNL